MRLIFASMMIFVALATPSIAEISARPIVVMVDDQTGAPLSSGTLVADGAAVWVVFPTRLQVQPYLCVRFRSDGDCYPLADPVELPGLLLTTALVNISSEALQSELTLETLSTTAIPPWAIVQLDTLAEIEPVWIGRNDFTNWRRPLVPARVTGASETGFTMAHEELGQLDEGGLVEDPQTGLIGIVARAQNGRAGIVGSRVLFDALLAAGLNIPAQMLPTQRTTELPPAVESEVGGFWVFSHYPGQEIGFSSFYGPSAGLGYAGWGGDFDTTVLYRVFSLDDHMQNGTAPPQLLAQSETRQTYGGSGWNLGAPFPDVTPDYLATCVIHAVPSAADRRIFQMTFWRQVAQQRFDQVAYSEQGWARDDSACEDAFARLGDARGIITSEAGRAASPATVTTSLEDDFELTSDPVSILPSAVARIDDLILGVTCGPGNQPVVFYRSSDGAPPHIMVDVYRANLEDWTAWQSGGVTTYHAPLHPQAALGWAYGAGTSVTFDDRNTILMGANGVSAAQTALGPCLE